MYGILGVGVVCAFKGFDALVCELLIISSYFKTESKITFW